MSFTGERGWKSEGSGWYARLLYVLCGACWACGYVVATYNAAAAVAAAAGACDGDDGAAIMDESGRPLYVLCGVC